MASALFFFSAATMVAMGRRNVKAGWGGNLQHSDF